MSGNLLEKIANLTKTIHLMLLDALRLQSFVALLVFQRESTFFLGFGSVSAVKNVVNIGLKYFYFTSVYRPCKSTSHRNN